MRRLVSIRAVSMLTAVRQHQACLKPCVKPEINGFHMDANQVTFQAETDVHVLGFKIGFILYGGSTEDTTVWRAGQSDKR